MSLWKCCTQYASKFGKLRSGQRTGKASFHSNPKGNAKECSNYCTIALISHYQINAHTSPSQALTVCELWTSRCSSQRSNCQHLLDHRKSKRVPENISTSILLTMPMPLTVWITTDCGKFLKRWEYQATWPASWEICMQIRKQQLELILEQKTGSISGKEYVKAVYCHPGYLTYVQSTSCEMLDWMNHRLE